jgi:hypothetical protein
MSAPPASPASPASIVSASAFGGPPPVSSEDELRRQLLSALQSLNRREPLDASYKRLLLGSALTRRSPVLPKDKFYSKVGSKLRERVETYIQQQLGKDPLDRIAQRKSLEEAAMRAAFTLREAKEHEQAPLLEALIAANQMDPERKRHLDGIAYGLQEKKKIRTNSNMLGSMSSMMSGQHHSLPSVKEQTERARQKAELDRQRAQARNWEEARRRREEEEQRRKEEELLTRKKSPVETPQQALHKIIEPVFKKLWDMEFVNLGGTNPFRIVIDRDNCASIGAPDYFDVIRIPMNLTYIQQKVSRMQYDTMQGLFADVDLMIENAISYNSDAGNPYRIAAEEMKRRHQKIKKKISPLLA